MFWCSGAQPQLLARGVSGFGALRTGINPSSPLPPSSRPIMATAMGHPTTGAKDPWDPHGTALTQATPGQQHFILVADAAGSCRGGEGSGQQVQWGVGAAQCPGRVPRHPMAAVSSTRRVVSERQPSRGRLLHPTAAGGNAFLEMTPRGTKPHDGSARRGRDLHCLASDPATALPCSLAQTHGRGGDGGTQGRWGAVLIPTPGLHPHPELQNGRLELAPLCLSRWGFLSHIAPTQVMPSLGYR